MERWMGSRNTSRLTCSLYRRGEGGLNTSGLKTVSFVGLRVLPSVATDIVFNDDPNQEHQSGPEEAGQGVGGGSNMKCRDRCGCWVLPLLLLIAVAGPAHVGCLAVHGSYHHTLTDQYIGNTHGATCFTINRTSEQEISNLQTKHPHLCR